MSIEVGQDVSYEEGESTVFGKVAKVNQASVVVEDDNGQKKRVKLHKVRAWEGEGDGEQAAATEETAPEEAAPEATEQAEPEVAPVDSLPAAEALQQARELLKRVDQDYTNTNGYVYRALIDDLRKFLGEKAEKQAS